MRMRLLRPSRTVEICLFAIRYSSWRFPIESSVLLLYAHAQPVFRVDRRGFLHANVPSEAHHVHASNSWAECGSKCGECGVPYLRKIGLKAGKKRL